MNPALSGGFGTLATERAEELAVIAGDRCETQYRRVLEAGLIMPDEKTCRNSHNNRSQAITGSDYKTHYEKIKNED